MNELVKSDWARRHGALTLGRTVQEIVWNMDKIDVHAGKFDHQIGWVLIAAATKILEAKMPSLFSSTAELIGVHELLKTIDPQASDFWAPEIRFTGHDFNRILHKNLSARNIEKIVGKLPTLIFRVNGREGLFHLRVILIDSESPAAWRRVLFLQYGESRRYTA
jgi:hypothetical protein